MAAPTDGVMSMPAGEGASAAPADRRDTTISRSLILRTALVILDRDGESGLSMRRLSEALGRDPTVLYRHVPNKGAVLDGVAELLAEGRKIEAIKLYRDRTGVGLKEAKDAVERLQQLGTKPARPDEV